MTMKESMYRGTTKKIIVAVCEARAPENARRPRQKTKIRTRVEMEVD